MRKALGGAFVNVVYRLICQQEHCFEAEFARAKVKQVLETGTKQLHDHDIVVALAATPLERWNADAALHQPIDLALNVELWVFGLGAFQLDGDLFVRCYVVAHVDVAE